MKKQGRQNGMAKAYSVISAMRNTRPRPRPRASNGPTSVPKVDQVTKAQIKPINRSKFTGKCGRPTCHKYYMCPKSKDKKTKEAQRLKSSVNVVPNYRLTTWRVVDTKSSMKLSGFSTIDVLEYLDRIDRVDHYYEGGDEDEETQC
ncbi:hypothetical protein SASPL_118326 [Salvia splendens]|uniref:Uncharacterized protein n=1 Tax=Salvia splendens TaxID=180675 RepID=A0A8X8ZZS9_SALSN|nr:uncharacterized protein LOC121809071 [Salvia splendens]KAG6421769.1 hypothetical protein SASPL_118326 [Salvia splendens]